MLSKDIAQFIIAIKRDKNGSGKHGGLNMKNLYIAVSIQEGDKNYAHAVKVNENDNLLSKLAIKNIKVANFCETKKKAAETVIFWNQCYKNNGTYLFDNPNF